MKYLITLDENSYIKSFLKDEKGIEFNPLSINLAYLNCYKLEDGKAVLDEEKLSLKKAEESRLTEITELKAYLFETSDIISDFIEEVFSLDKPLTFVADLIALIIQYRTEFKSLLAQRKQARERIKELEKQSHQ